MSSNVEHALPQKARLRRKRARMSEVRREHHKRTGAAMDGVMLLSRRRLLLVMGAERREITIEEPFRVELYRWQEPGDEGNPVEVNVVVRQRDQSVAFCVELPAELVRPTLPLRQSVDPYVSLDAFARLWPPLRVFAEIHGGSRLGGLDLSEEALDELCAPARNTPQPQHIEVKENDRLLTIVPREHPLIAWGSALGLGAMVVIGAGALAWTMTSNSNNELLVVVMGGSMVALTLFGHLLQKLTSRGFKLWFSVSASSLAVDGMVLIHEANRRQDAVYERRELMRISTEDLDQLYVTDEDGQATLWALLTDEREVQLATMTSVEDACFIEERVERFLSITDRPILGEYRP